ncbi:DUF2142 domain-containing protein [Methanobrevibacter sp. 87.7]|uniref:DUF2142 domain-containing protein n=1 Tax=Methanobrevibacter sp. 87.7 TaxID=387957 RepID=UPI00117C8523|nr:DUF2142 domain-containing protein [Methanobrevibacter sp. 87.7]
MSFFSMKNYIHPKMEIAVIFLVSILGIFFISFYQYHNSDNEIYKVAFIIILTFGIICSFLTPICFIPDGAEHFVRSEMTSEGILVPHYENGSYMTIQTTLDLIKNSKNTLSTKYDKINGFKANIFQTDADTKSINYTHVKYPSAFAQNPFYGYLAQGFGMFIAKSLNLNAIWLLWLGRICNVILYSVLIALAVKKTPILKVPMIVFSCIPLAIYQSSSLSIDAFINGLAILMIAYFFWMYKAPDRSLGKKELIIFTIIGLLLGLTKITLFLFMLLILCLPKSKFKEDKYYYLSILCIIFVGILGLIWIKFYASYAFQHSFRHNYWILKNINNTSQLNYVLSHKFNALIGILSIFTKYLDNDLLLYANNLFINKINSVYLMFIGAIILLYPSEKIDLKSKISVFILIVLIYVGTYITFLFTWTPIGHLNNIIGVKARYFLPLFVLLPFVFGFNHMEGDKSSIDMYAIVLTISFLALMLISSAIKFY